jgi:hypothetical protein
MKSQNINDIVGKYAGNRISQRQMISEINRESVKPPYERTNLNKLKSIKNNQKKYSKV